LTERLLTDLLGLDWVKAHQEAHRLEHAISPEVEEKLDTLLNHPTTCPHGNPIPGSAAGQTRHRPASLHQIAEGREVTLECITEGGERDARLLAFMQDHQLAPGTRIQVVETSPSLGTMSLKVGDSVITLGLEAAKKIRVQ
jgi:DtxR family Mn-dependent transcriptional regulator